MEVLSNPHTKYRCRIGFGASYHELHLDTIGFAELDTAQLGPSPGTYTYTDVTSQLTNIEIRRGRYRTTDRVQAGTCVLTFYDPSRNFDPENTAGPYYGNLQPRRPVIVDAKTPSGSYQPLYTGWITGIGYRQEPGGYLTAEISCADNLATLAIAQLTADLAVSAESSGTRVTNVINAVAYPGSTNIATGDTTFVAGTIPAGTNALDYLTQCMGYEWGELFDSHDGVLTFRKRSANLNPITSVTFTPDTSGIQYTTIDVQRGDEVYTIAQADDNTGATVTATDLAAALNYGSNAITISGGLMNNGDCQTLTNYVLNLYDQPTSNVRSIEVLVDLTVSNTEEIALFGTDIGDAVKIQRTFTVGSPLTITAYYAVEGITHVINRATHTVTMRLGNQTTGGYMTLDNAAFGILDTNLLAPG